MNNEHWDELLEEGLSGEPPREGFREQVLRESVAAFARVRRTRARWRVASLSAAAVLIAGVAFLLGRYSLPAPAVDGTPIAASVTARAEGVTVSNDLVAWLQTAQLFRKLGMQDRMARAIDHASKLLPYDIAVAGGSTEPLAAADGGDVESRGSGTGSIRTAGLPESVESVNRIMALFLRGQDHAE